MTREFGIYGKIESIKIIPPKCETIKHFIAFINFSTAESAENALIAKQNKIILGQPVKIKYGKKITQVIPTTAQAQLPLLIPTQIQPNALPITPLLNPTPVIPNQSTVNIVHSQQSLPNAVESGYGHPPLQVPFTQGAYLNPNIPYQYPFMQAQQTPVYQLHPQLLVYPPPNPAFPMQQMYAIPHLYVKFPDNFELRKKIDEISMVVFKVIFF